MKGLEYTPPLILLSGPLAAETNKVFATLGAVN